MWRAGVSCKMRRLVLLQVYGCPMVQLQLPKTCKISQALAIRSLSSWQQSPGSEVSADGAFLFKQSLQVRIYDALRFGDKKMAVDFLGHLGSMEDSLAVEDCIPLLEYCCNTPDPEFTLEVWRFMDKKQLNIKRDGYIFILRALANGGYLDVALYLLKLLGENSCMKPGVSMYNIFLNGCSKYHSLGHANSCLELMEKNCIGKSEITYTELMKIAVRGHNVSAVNRVWEEYNKFYLPSIFGFQKLIQSLCRMSASAEANEALQKMILIMLKGRITSQRSHNSWFHASKVQIPIPFKAFNESANEALNQKFGTRHLPGSDGPHVFQMDVPSVCSCKKREAVNSSEWDILNQSQKDKNDFGNQLLLDSMNEDKLESQLLNDTGKYGVQHSEETTVIKQEDRMETHTKIAGIPSNRQTFYSKHHSASLNETGMHATAGHCKMEEAASDSVDLKKFSCLPALNALIYSFNDVIHLAGVTRNYDLAENLFLQMHSLGLEPRLKTYNVFLEAVVLQKGVNHGMKVVKAMESRGLKQNNFTNATLVVGYSQSRQLDQAEKMLDRMVDRAEKMLDRIDVRRIQYRHAFHSLLGACCIEDEPERAVRVLARMKRVEMKPNLRTYELIFSLFGNVNPPYEKGNHLSHEAVSKRISLIEMDMVRNGVEHSQRSMRNLLRALGAEGMNKELLQYLHIAEVHFNGRDAPLLGISIYNIVLHALVDAKECDVAIDIFERVKSSGIKPDAATYNIMIDCCSLNRDLEYARGLMATLLQDGYKYHACTYTSLMKVMLANNDFEAAMDIFNEMKDEGIRSDVISYNTIFREAAEKARFDIIELLVEHMHRQKIQPDTETCLHVFSSYYERGFVDTALEALQVLSVRMMSEDETVQREMKSSFQELILDDDPDVEESLVNIFKDSKEYLSASLFNMRLCAFAGVSITWIPDESPWAIRLSSQYDQAS